MNICSKFECGDSGSRCPQDGKFCSILFGFSCRHVYNSFNNCKECQHRTTTFARNCPVRLSSLEDVG